MIKHKYAIRDKVTWINQQGVNLGEVAIIALTERTGLPTYEITPHDAPWFSVSEKELHLTTTLVNGRVVLAKPYEGNLWPITYANETQARKRVAQLGEGWHVTGRRPYYATAHRPATRG